MNIKKHLLITGTSTVSWKDAILKTLEETSKTLTNVTDVKVIEQRANITENKIVEYFVDLDLGFNIDLSKKIN